VTMVNYRKPLSNRLDLTLVWRAELLDYYQSIRLTSSKRNRKLQAASEQGVESTVELPASSCPSTLQTASVSALILSQMYTCIAIVASFVVLALYEYLAASSGVVPKFGLFLLSYRGSEDDGTNTASSIAGRDTPIILNTTFCTDKCFGDCVHFLTPAGQCYNGQNMFDGEDNPFGEHDILDQTIKNSVGIVGIKRDFYQSTNGTCSGGITDSFDDIPVDECVGPIGPPRPWCMISTSEESIRIN